MKVKQSSIGITRQKKMKLPNTTIVLGICTVTATGLSDLKVNKNLIFGSTAVLVRGSLMIALRDEDNLNKYQKDYEYFFDRAQYKFEIANYKEAIVDYNKALELSSIEICLVYSMRGNAKRNSDDLDEAISEQNKALKFDPLYADGSFNR